MARYRWRIVSLELGRPVLPEGDLFVVLEADDLWTRDVAEQAMRRAGIRFERLGVEHVYASHVRGARLAGMRETETPEPTEPTEPTPEPPAPEPAPDTGTGDDDE